MADVKKCRLTGEEIHGVDTYPGVATNVADDCKVDAKMVDNETKELNNNPNSAPV